MSDLNQFRSKGPELLVELAQHTSETVREIIDIEPEVADQIGQAVANRMMQVWGGQNVYFPMGMVWKVSQRDREIFREFNGRNHHEHWSGRREPNDAGLGRAKRLFPDGHGMEGQSARPGNLQGV
ncbi:Mor transcription activator family protein [Escherichia coli]|uniref:Mor transcription activator family protein n=1 Tax=Escherichia coli TaxID=562 RepID=UPI002022D29B|nr:Mor transcription activator family protein [Escherichia coli]